MSKIPYYTIDRIKKENAQINLIIGERSNGKSYQVKHEEAIYPFINSYNKLKKEGILESAYNKLDRFFLLRRLEAEIKNSFVEKYFNDVDIYKITNGEYDCIDVYRKEIYFAKWNEEKHKPIRGIKIGYVGSLSTEQNYAGGSYLDVKNIIFEEFMSRGVYLGNNEPTKLMNFYSTIDRKRGIVKLWLVGNTISKICPYYQDWGLLDVLKKMKQGDLVSINLPTGDVDDSGNPILVKVAIEYCKSTGKSSYVIGDHASMLNRGAWQSDPQPTLTKNYKDFKFLFRVGFEYSNFRFIGEYLKDNSNNNFIWFIYPYEKEFNKKIKLIFSDQVKNDIRYQRNIYNLTIDNPALRSVFSTFRESNIFYASDEVGTDFKQAIDFSIIK
jgi:hypothetical protein